MKNKKIKTESDMILGLKIVAIRGYKERKNMSPKNLDASYILFDDKKTFIYFEKQDGYEYHDCNHSARTMVVLQDKQRWEDIMTDNDHYGNVLGSLT
jgi:hypothetical protein